MSVRPRRRSTSGSERKRPLSLSGATKVALAVSATAAVCLTAGVATGAIPGGGGKISACYTKIGGVLRVIDVEKASPERCTRFEESISWNQAGQPGPAGPAGPAGPKGDKGDKGEAGDRLSPEATTIQQQAEDTLSKAKLGKPKVSSKQAHQVANLEPAPGEAFQFLRSEKVQLADWFKTKQYTYLGRLVLPKGRFGVTLTARASATAGAPDYPSTYQGRVSCLVRTQATSDGAEGQGVIALQRAVTLQKAVNSVTLHCTGWAGALSNARLVATRLRKITTFGH
jgi:hypothetical protein